MTKKQSDCLPKTAPRLPCVRSPGAAVSIESTGDRPTTTTSATDRRRGSEGRSTTSMCVLTAATSWLPARSTHELASCIGKLRRGLGNSLLNVPSLIQLGFRASDPKARKRRCSFLRPLARTTTPTGSARSACLPRNGRRWHGGIWSLFRALSKGMGQNGEYVLFYERTDDPPKPREPQPPKADHTELLDGLHALGLTSVTAKQVAEAVAVCYPKGTCNVDENDILRTVFRHLKRAGIG